MYARDLDEMKREEAEQFRRAEEFRRMIHPIVFLPLMTKPVRSVEKENAEKYMRELLDKTRAELRLPNG